MESDANDTSDTNDAIDSKRSYESEARLGKKLCAIEDEFGSYDVFISHRGPDTKTGFVGYLYEALKRVGLHPFLDCISIGKGQDSWACIDHAIKTTPLALVIFSQSFIQSEWCLKELHAMLDSPSMKVLPIFYNVQPWEVNFPEKGQLSVGFLKLTERHDTSVSEEWRADLKRASKLTGWEYKVGDKRSEKDLALEVVAKICKLANKPLPLDEVKQVAEYLINTIDEKKVSVLGLVGMGGIGKSTLAKEVYNQLGQRFDAMCYVEDVVEKVNQGGVMTIQNYILKALCVDESMLSIVDKSKNKAILEERLSKKSILLVLDNIHDHDQLDYLLSHKMLKEGSICIVTSRNYHTFEKSTSFHVNHDIYIHDVQLMRQEDSQSLFAYYAFGDEWEVPQRFESLVGGLQHLKSLDLIRSGIQRLPESLGLLSDLKEWSLKDRVVLSDSLEGLQHLKSLDLERSGIQTRIQSLPESFGLFSNLVVLSFKNCSEFVELPDSFGGLQHLKSLDLERSRIQRLPESLGLLSNLEELSLKDCGELMELPDSLEGLQNLKSLDLERSGIQRLPKSLGTLSNLEVLSLKDCGELVELPDSLEGLQNLKSLDLERSGIQRLPKSLGTLSNLEVLSLKDCGELVELPDSLEGLQHLKSLDLERSGIQRLPKSLGTLSNLEVLSLKDCGELMELPDSLEGLQHLKSLDLERSGIQRLPKSLGTLGNLEVLSLKDCGELVELPDSLEGLQHLKSLDLERSGIQRLSESLGMLGNLEVLNLKDCGELVELPDSLEGLQHLKSFDLERSGIQRLSKSLGTLGNLEELSLKDCGVEVQDNSKTSSPGVSIEDDDCLSKNFKGAWYTTKWIIHGDLLERTLLCFFNVEEMQYEFYFEDHESMATIIGLGVPYSKVILKCGNLYVIVVEILKEDWNAMWALPNIISYSIPEGYVLKQKQFPDILHCIANIININNIASKANNNGVGGNSGKDKAQDNADVNKGKGKAHDHSDHENGHSNRGSNGARDDNDKKDRKGKDRDSAEKNNDDEDDGKISNDCKEVQAIVHLRLLPGGNLIEKKKEGEVHDIEVEEMKKEGECSKGVEKKKKPKQLWHFHKLDDNGNVVGNHQKQTNIEEVQNGDVDENLQKQLEKQIHSYMVFTFTIKDEAGGQLKTIQATIDPITFQLPSNNEENYLQRRRFGWFHKKLQVAFGVVNAQVADLDAKSCKIIDSSEVKEVNLQGNLEGNARTCTNAIKGELGIKHGVIASARMGRIGGTGSHTAREVQNSWETNKPLTKAGFSILEHTNLNVQQLKYSYHPHLPFKEKEFDVIDEDDRLKMYEHPICQLQRVSCEGTWYPDHSEYLEKYKLEASRELGMTRIYNLEPESRMEKMRKGVSKIEKSSPLCFIQKLEKVLYLNHSLSHLTSSTTEVYRVKERQDSSNTSISILTQAQNKREPIWPDNDRLVDVKE